MAQFAVAVLYAVSSGLGFDPGVGVEAKLEAKYFELSASATNERKYHADSGYTWSGAALLMCPVKDVRFFGGATVYGYKTDDWEKQATSPIIGAEYRGDKLRIRLDHQFENEHNDEFTSLGIEGNVQDALVRSERRDYRQWQGCRCASHLSTVRTVMLTQFANGEIFRSHIIDIYLKAGETFHLSLLSVLHIDSSSCYWDGLKKLAKERNKLPNHGVLAIGDLCDLVMPPDVKRYRPTARARELDGRDDYLTAAIEMVIDRLNELKFDWHLISPGNHEDAAMKFHGVDATSVIAHALGCKRGAYWALSIEHGRHRQTISGTTGYPLEAEVEHWLHHSTRDFAKGVFCQEFLDEGKENVVLFVNVVDEEMYHAP